MRRVVAGLLALLATLVTAGAATAHVSVLPTELVQEESAQLTIRVPNERTDADTVRVRVGIPEQVTVYSLGPAPPGWKATAIRGADGKFATLVFTGGSIPPERYADFTVLATAFESGQAVWPVVQGFSDDKDKPWTGPPEKPGEASAETGPTDPGPAAAQTILQPGQAPATGAAAGGGGGDGDSDTAIWLGVIAIGIAALAVLATGFLWSTRPARLPEDDEEDAGP
ncbi:MAG TPA: DUF1775 domain-containing protein [Miltoncostaeaceae bacterium]|nr:DUF1775 domain-containing protein [Miltoncostaeaceae bacterium]